MGSELPPFTPASRIDGQSLPWGECLILASRRQESHLHRVPVIKDLDGLSPQSLALKEQPFLGNGSHTLDKNIQYVAILIHCPPKVMEASVDFKEHLIQVPLVTRPRRSAAQAVGVCLTEFETPFSDRTHKKGRHRDWTSVLRHRESSKRSESRARRND